MTHPTVLLVDPHDDQRSIYSDALHAAGFWVIECPDGRNAIYLAASIPLLVIVTEVGSERSGCGWELIANLRADTHTAATPIIALGSRWIRDELDGAHAKGATEYLPIPLSPPDLVDAVRRVAMRRRRGDRV